MFHEFHSSFKIFSNNKNGISKKSQISLILSTDIYANETDKKKHK